MFSSVEYRFMNAISKSYQMYVSKGSRSNEKTKVLHGFKIS